MELSPEQDAELRALVNSRDASAVLATRARIVLWHAQGRARKDIGPLACGARLLEFVPLA